MLQHGWWLCSRHLLPLTARQVKKNLQLTQIGKNKTKNLNDLDLRNLKKIVKEGNAL